MSSANPQLRDKCPSLGKPKELLQNYSLSLGLAGTCSCMQRQNLALGNEGKAHAPVLELPQHPRTLPLAEGEKQRQKCGPC